MADVIDLDSDASETRTGFRTGFTSTDPRRSSVAPFNSVLDKDIRTWTDSEACLFPPNVYQVDAAVNVSVNPAESIGENPSANDVLCLYLSTRSSSRQALLMSRVEGITPKPEHSGTKIIVKSTTFDAADASILYDRNITVLGGCVERLRCNAQKALDNHARRSKASLVELSQLCLNQLRSTQGNSFNST